MLSDGGVRRKEALLLLFLVTHFATTLSVHDNNTPKFFGIWNLALFREQTLRSHAALQHEAPPPGVGTATTQPSHVVAKHTMQPC